MKSKRYWAQLPLMKKLEIFTLLSALLFLGIMLITIVYFKEYFDTIVTIMITLLLVISIIIAQLGKPKKVKN